MTLEEFLEDFRNGWKVKCSSVQERYDVLQFLAELGFVLGPTTRRALTDPLDSQDLRYPNPGYTPRVDYNVSNFSNSGLPPRYHLYQDIAELICPPFDAPTDADLSALFS
jgi:hypothetical protein